MPLRTAYRQSEPSTPLEPVARPAPFFGRPGGAVATAGVTFAMPVTKEFEQYLKQCDEPTLVGLLRAMQARLGTAHEGPEDFDRAAAVMHQVNNLRTIRAMAEEVSRMGEAAGEQT